MNNKNTAFTVPVEFARVILDWASEHGIDRETYLTGTNVSSEILDTEDGRISINDHYRLVMRGIDLIGKVDGLGYELGLRIGLTTHAGTGFALLSQVSFQEAISFGIKFSQLIIPIYIGKFSIEEDVAVIDVSLIFNPQTELHHYFYDMALTTVWSGLRHLIGGLWPNVELWFAYPEPEYFSRYSDKLPPCKFGMGVNQLRFPAEQLSRKIKTGDPVMAKLATEKFEKEHSAQQKFSPVVDKISQLLVSTGDGYPGLTAISHKICMSERTLKRKLQQEDTNFQQLLDDARKADAIRLLMVSGMTVDEISNWLGYSNSSNFTHAFRRWTNMSPGEYRIQHKSVSSI